ncbi:MAG: hypothetical protein IT356_03585 [Gemmatimonadaceae bacterium]|nr:hypothetical protein [Gemmatimonadaceae bacterium]
MKPRQGGARCGIGAGVARTAALVLALFAGSRASRAQTAPDLHYRAIRTQHFDVVFSPGLEDVARRAAGSGERAWAGLARELHAPRGRVSVVVADNYDISNGYASTFPTNRIVIYARPMVDAITLRFIDDWVDLVMTHELTHIFHLDRARGVWQLGQWVLGRNPFLFPNGYSPNWLTEGLAVYYESRLTGAGRNIGTDFAAIARAQQLTGRAPGPHDLSSASPLYPLGNLPYVYGAPLVARVAAAKPDAMRRFVDVSAARVIPFMPNMNARAAFGVSFDSTFRAWSDSMRHAAESLTDSVGRPAPRVRAGWSSGWPRWSGDTAIVWPMSSPGALPSLRSVNVATGRVTMLDELNSTDAMTLLPGGVRVFAQQEFTDPYTMRTDLYLAEGGDTRRLTTGERLTHPDARRCGAALCVVAVQLEPGAARLVMVTVEGGAVTVKPLTEASATSVWSEPRWSRAGDRIAAAHWMYGGTSEIGIFDRNGALLTTLGRSRAVNGAPAWGAGDSAVFFTSDRSGRSALYSADVRSGALTLVADSPTAFYDADISPDGRRAATLLLAGDGLGVTVVEATTPGAPADSTSVLPPSRGAPVATTDAPVTTYWALPSTLPRYWTPLVSEGYADAYRVGVFSNGYDLVGRHAWQASITQDTKRNEPEYDVGYSFAGLGVPVAGIGTSQAWDHPGVPDSARVTLLPVERRRRFVTADLGFMRRRFRSAVSLSVGGRYEWRDFRTMPEAPEARFAPADRAVLARTFTYPSVFIGAGLSTARQPALSLGPENGFSLAASVTRRWRSDAPDATRATGAIGALVAYRAFDAGSLVHHLLAVRVAAAGQDITSATEYQAGGNSGTAVEVVPGVVFGDGRRTFLARGFEPGTLTGNRALGANAEYRFPLGLPGRGVGATPLFLQRVSGAVFADAATAWCSSGSGASPICPAATARKWLASVGAELHLDAALQYDAPYRLRLGVAMPTASPGLVRRTLQSYVTLGLPF